MYDKEYQVDAQNCAIVSPRTIKNSNNPGMGMKITTNVAAKQLKYVTEVKYRFSSNMFLQWGG